MYAKAVSGIMLTLLLVSMLTLALSVQPVNADLSSSPVVEWSRTYGGPDWEFGTSLVQTSDGGYALLGETRSFGAGMEDLWLVKTDPYGNQMWAKTYGGANDEGACHTNCLRQTTDIGFVLTGQTQSFGAGDSDIWLVKTNSAGVMAWNKTFGTVECEEPSSVIQTSDGGYMVLGYTGNVSETHSDIYIVKTDAFGNKLWVKTYDVSDFDLAVDVVEIADGYVVVGDVSKGVLLVKLDMSGNVEWEKTHEGSWSASALLKTADGGYAITGHATTSSFDFCLIETDSAGNIQWSKTFGGPEGDLALSVEGTDDGGFVMAGYTWSFGAGGSDMWLVKTDASGNMMWNLTYGGQFWDYGCTVANVGGGEHVIAGYTRSFGAGMGDLWLIKVKEQENQAPNRPTSLSQHKSDGTTTIPEGGTTPESIVVFKGTLSDPDEDDVRLEIELRQTSEAFTGEPTPETISDFVPSGTEVTKTRYDLVNADYKWQYRTKDIHGATSDWSEYGTAGNTDFTVAIITEEWSFAIITDLHIGFGYPDYGAEGFDDRPGGAGQNYYLTDRLAKTVGAINNNPQIKFVVVLGDISDTAEYSEFLKAKEILNDLKVPYIPALGNHDVWPYTQEPEPLPSTELLSLLKLLDGFDILDLMDPGLRELLQDLALYWWDPYIPLTLPVPGSPLHFLPDDREIAQKADPEHGDRLGDQFFNELFWQTNNENLQKIGILFGASWRRQNEQEGYKGLPYIQNYNFTYQGTRFIVLDCNVRTHGISGAQLFVETEEWLRENLKLAREKNQPVILFSHHPLMFSVLPPPIGEQCFSLGEIDKIRDIIEESGANVLAAFGGHSHSNFVVCPGYKYSITIDKEFDLPLVGKKTLKAGFGVECRLATDVVITEAVCRESIRWLSWWDKQFPEQYSKLPLRTETRDCIRIVTMDLQAIKDYEKFGGMLEDGNLRPTSYFTCWPTADKINNKHFTAFPYDPDGYPQDCKYAWSFGDGGTASSKRAVWHHYKAGEYTVSLTVADGGGDSGGLFSRTLTVRKMIEIRLWSPADLIVTDPDGFVLTKDVEEIPGMSYWELDIDDDGETEDLVTIWEEKTGDYLIAVVPEPNASSTDKYTLDILSDDTLITLAKDIAIIDIPTQSYTWVIAEFSSIFLIALFMITTLLAVAVYRRNALPRYAGTWTQRRKQDVLHHSGVQGGRVLQDRWRQIDKSTRGRSIH